MLNKSITLVINCFRILESARRKLNAYCLFLGTQQVHSTDNRGWHSKTNRLSRWNGNKYWKLCKIKRYWFFTTVEKKFRVYFVFVETITIEHSWWITLRVCVCENIYVRVHRITAYIRFSINDRFESKYLYL